MKVHSTLNFAYEHTVNKVMHPPQNIFDIYSTDRAKKIGTLICHKSEIPLRPDYEGSVLAVDFIEVNRPNKGFGTKILKFAEDYSREIGCKGYLTLKADSSFTPNKIPHTFYRRFGFTTLNAETDKQLDKFIKTNTNATINDFPSILMHYPITSRQTSKSMQVFAKIKKQWCNFLHQK